MASCAMARAKARSELTSKSCNNTIVSSWLHYFLHCLYISGSLVLSCFQVEWSAPSSWCRSFLSCDQAATQPHLTSGVSSANSPQLQPQHLDIHFNIPALPKQRQHVRTSPRRVRTLRSKQCYGHGEGAQSPCKCSHQLHHFSQPTHMCSPPHS